MNTPNYIDSEKPVLVADIAMSYLSELSGSDALRDRADNLKFIGSNLQKIIKNTLQVTYVESDREQLIDDYLMSQVILNDSDAGVKYGIFAPERNIEYVASLYSCLSGISKNKLTTNTLNNAEIEHISTTAHNVVSSFIDNNELMYMSGVMSIDDVDRYLSTSDVDVLVISAGASKCMSNEDLELLQFSALLYGKKIVVGTERHSQNTLRNTGVVSSQQSSHLRLDLTEGCNVLCNLKLMSSTEVVVKGAWDYDCHRLAFLD